MPENNLKKFDFLKLSCALLFFIFFGATLIVVANEVKFELLKRKNRSAFLNQTLSMWVADRTPPEIIPLIEMHEFDLAVCLKTNPQALYEIKLPLNLSFDFPLEAHGRVTWQADYPFWSDGLRYGQTLSFSLGRLRHFASCFKTNMSQIQFWYSQMLLDPKSKVEPQKMLKESLNNFYIRLQLKTPKKSLLIFDIPNNPPFHIAETFSLQGFASDGKCKDLKEVKFTTTRTQDILNNDQWILDQLDETQKKALACSF